MKIERFHPLGILIYFLCVLTLTAFSGDPYLLAIAFSGALAGLLSLGALTPTAALLPVFTSLFCAVINPLFSSRGETELLFINDTAVTLESLLSGAVTGASLGVAMLLCILLTRVLGPSKLLSLLGRSAPKCAAVLCSAIAFLPEMMRKHERIRDAQRAVGRLPDGGTRESILGTVRIWTALIGLAFEDAVQQARLTEALGYDIDGGRVPYIRARFARRDLIFCCFCAAMFIFSASAYALGLCETSVYPVFYAPRTLTSIPSYICAAALFFSPAAINIFGDKNAVT